eukprot:CAMPEP_0117558032 /NCGR_PEP_ID=MMETSP0784-20121206/52627_1 /TAXON_ID=39447 /ORGANISM="" /LENGTH=54 /DNA_ID=CAMNT_0005355349 /DNA_START=517 /DNA_END=681 /DNA_ORIENTATION=+
MAGTCASVIGTIAARLVDQVKRPRVAQETLSAVHMGSQDFFAPRHGCVARVRDT